MMDQSPVNPEIEIPSGKWADDKLPVMLLQEIAEYESRGIPCLTLSKMQKRGLEIFANRCLLRPDAQPKAINTQGSRVQEYFSKADYYPAYGRWEKIPPNLKTRTSLAKLNLRPTGSPVAKKTGGYGPWDL
jgi:hypothetical protein